MKIDTPITAADAASDQTLDRLRRGTESSGKAALNEAGKKEIKKVARDFEALFLNMMLKSMRQTLSEDKLTGGGKAEETYRFMLDQEYAGIASKRGVGLASLVEKELLKRYESGGLTPAAIRNTKSEEDDVNQR